MSDRADPPIKRDSRGIRPLGICALLVAVPVALISGVGLWVYGLSTPHATRDGIWWSGTARGLTPPTARDITLQRDFLDHRALYTVSTADLEAFIRDRFDGSEVDPLPATRLGEEIGELGWTVTPGSTSYHTWMSNGAATYIHHDPATGLTYQSSAHW